MDVDFMHDLRLSIQLAQSSAEMLKLSLNQPNADAEGYLGLLLEALMQVRRMLEHGMTVRQGFQTVDVPGRLKVMCRQCLPYAVQQGVQLSFTSNVGALTARLDGDLLSRVVLNLAMNALRFAPPGGRVAVALTALGDFLEISVSDDGPGIAPERLPYIFLRGETDGGGGYGLPAAMACACNLGGSLSVTSVPGNGTTFTLRLPVGEALAS